MWVSCSVFCVLLPARCGWGVPCNEERRSDAARGRPVDSNTVKDFMLMVVHAEFLKLSDFYREKGVYRCNY